jgi:hypothetical protein
LLACAGTVQARQADPMTHRTARHGLAKDCRLLSGGLDGVDIQDLI